MKYMIPGMAVAFLAAMLSLGASAMLPACAPCKCVVGEMCDCEDGQCHCADCPCKVCPGKMFDAKPCCAEVLGDNARFERLEGRVLKLELEVTALKAKVKKD